ncbi:MAG: hypothetical protein QM802_18405 [Agriterribacter sp.]
MRSTLLLLSLLIASVTYCQWTGDPYHPLKMSEYLSTDPAIVRDDGNGAVIAWNDNRNNNADIYIAFRRLLVKSNVV